MTALTRSNPSSPCGCGGASHSHSSPSGCGCGGSCGCGAGECRDGAAVRPRFFAGQLLTEEDLQALSAYVAAKSRLHNRHFFGEGVVCGFEVTCHPCGGGKVIVHPGHALDCCGNDVVLASAQTLDVNALVRDLRQRLLGGYDCGDPCAEKPVAATKTAPSVQIDPAMDISVPAPAPEKPVQILPSNRRHYCLYVRYCETLTDPVSAYLTDEPCSATGCEPTRVREGLRFELRCREHAKPPAGAIGRIAACLGDGKELQKLVTGLTALDRIVRQSEAALQIDRENLPFALQALQKSAADVDGAATTATGNPTGVNVRAVVTQVGILTRHLEKHNLLTEAERTKLGQARVDAINLAVTGLGKVAGGVLPNIAKGAPTNLEKSFARSVLERTGRAINAADPGRVHQALWTDTSIPVLDGQMDEPLCTLREELLDRLDASPDLAHCALRGEVQALPVPCPPQQTTRDFATRVDLARKLVAAWVRFWQDCVCRALLPPCPPCDDPAVLLACLEVESCEVVGICNLERTFVPTAVALRHWLPLHLLGELVERLCCRDLRWPELPDVQPAETINLRTSLPQMVTFAREGFLDAEVLSAFSGLVPQPAAPAVAAPVGESAAAPPAPALDREELIRAVEERLDLAAVRRLETAQKKGAEGLKQAQTELAGLRRELGVQAAKYADQVAKNADQVAKNAAQLAKNAELERRLKALEGRKKP